MNVSSMVEQSAVAYTPRVRFGPCIQVGFWPEKTIKYLPKAHPPTRRRVYKLLARDLKSGIRVSFRMARREYNELIEVAHALSKEAGEPVTVSEVVRDALYEAHGIGELEES